MRRLDVPRVAAASTVSLVTPDAAEDAWDALCEATGAPPFYRPGWYRRWSAAFAPDRLRVALAHEHGELVAALPLVVGHGVTRGPVNGHTPAFGVVATDAGAARRLLCDLLDLTPRGLHLEELQLSPIEAAELEWELGSRARHATLAPAAATTATDVRGSWDDYLARLHADRRRELRRSLQRAGRHGEITLTRHCGGADLLEVFAECLAVEASGWKGREGTAIASQPATRRFYEQLVTWSARHGWLELHTLRLDGRLVAMQLALRHGATLYLLKTGYDEQHAAAAPGKCLQHEILHDAFDDPGLDRVEWLGADGELKRVLGTDTRVLYRLAAFPAGPAGSLAHLASRSTWRSGAWARAHLPAGVRARMRSARNRWEAHRSEGGPR